MFGPIVVARAIIVDSNLQEPAPNYTVNGKCTLAEAIKAVNTQTQVDTCHGEPSPPSPAVTTILLLNNDYNLAVVNNTSATGQNGLPVLTGNSGNGSTIIIDGNNSTIRVLDCGIPKRIFEVASGTTITLKNLTLTQGCVTTSKDGSTIYNAGALSLKGVTVSNGGAAGRGGGIFNSAGATLNIESSLFSGNSAFNGGAIVNYGSLAVLFSTFVGNATSYGNAGAITNAGSGTLSVDRTVFRFNGAGSYAANLTSGAIYNVSSGSTTISNSCLIRNSYNTFGSPLKQAVVNYISNVSINAANNWWNSDGTATASAGGTDGRPGPLGPSIDINADTISNNVIWSPASGTLPSFCKAKQYAPPLQDFIGVFRPSNSTFYLLYDIRGGVPNVTFAYGYPSVLPVAGDWNGDGIDTVGVFDPGRSEFLLTNVNGPSLPDYDFYMGVPGGKPLVGRWTAAAQHDGVGIYVPSNGLAYLKNELVSTSYDTVILYGNPGDLAVAGDWNGDYDHIDGLGVYHPSNSTFYLENDICTCQIFDDYHMSFGAGVSTPVPIAGNWVPQDGYSGIGIFDSDTATFYMKNQLVSGGADYITQYGGQGDIPLIGHWKDLCLAGFNNAASGLQPPCQGPILPTVTPTGTLSSTLVPSPIPTNTSGSCSVLVHKPFGSISTGLALRESPTINSPRLDTIPWTYIPALTAFYRIDIGSDIWYQVNYNSKNGWIAAKYGGLTNVDNTGCSLPAPYPSNWPAIADIDKNKIPGNCDINAYFQTESSELVMARIAYAESATYGVQSTGADYTGGVVFEDALRISWIVRMDAFMGLPNYGAHGVAGRSVSIVAQVTSPNSYQPITDLQSGLRQNGCNPASITQDNVRRMVYPSNGSDKAELYQLFRVYVNILNNVYHAAWSTMPSDIVHYEQFKGVPSGTNCPSGANNLTRPGSGFDWAANQPYPPVPVYAFRDPSNGANQIFVTCYQDIYHLDDLFWAALTAPQRDLAQQPTGMNSNIFPTTFCVVRLKNPTNLDDFYDLAQLTGKNGTPWPPGTCNIH